MLPLPPALFTTVLGAGKRFFSCQMRCIVRAVRSTPPPAAEPTMSSTFFSGFQVDCAYVEGSTATTHALSTVVRSAAPIMTHIAGSSFSIEQQQLHCTVKPA